MPDTIGRMKKATASPQREGASELETHPLSAERLPHLAALFGEGGDPKWCWCSAFRVRGPSWNYAPRRTRIGPNRAVLTDAVRTTSAAGRAPGLVAYRDGKAVGWVSVGPREDYDRLAHSKVLAPLDERPVWSIVCFVVSKQARGQGIAHALLAAAIAYAREHGATLLEAYPIEPVEHRLSRPSKGGRVPAGYAFAGTVSMFERAGFEVVARRQFNKTSPVQPILRRRIRRIAKSAPAVVR
jgi:GNAT superfamily N-acetyltransferase